MLSTLDMLHKQRQCALNGVSAVRLHASTIHVGYVCKEQALILVYLLYFAILAVSPSYCLHMAQAGICQLNCSIVCCHWHVTWADAQRSALAIERTCGVHIYYALFSHCDGATFQHEVEASLWSCFHVAQSAALLPLAYAKCSK